MPISLTDKGIEERIERLVQQNPGRYSREDCLRDLMKERPELKPERYWKILKQIVEARKIQILRGKGLAVVGVSRRKRRKLKRPAERTYYDQVKETLGTWYTYVRKVSEEGKRWKTLATVPDVAGIQYLPGPYSDDILLAVVEVKTERPNPSHLSQCFRYSRFSDFCYIAISKEELGGYDEEYSRYILEAERLGIGVISFWRRTTQGREKYTVDLDAVKQTPDSIEKQDYLAEVVGIWRCAKCHTYHPKDEGTMVMSKRSQTLAGDNELDAPRFVCRSCVKL